nr:MAG TPA: hypothetical protein [Caudoviricetes sp.]
MAGGRATLLHHVLQRIGFEAWAAAAGFDSVEAAMKSRGTGIFIRASMRAQIAADTNGRGEQDGG